MLFRKRPAVLLSLAILLTSVTACGGSPTAKTLEQSLAADPRLKNNPAIFGESQSNEGQPRQKEPTVQLPSDFPSDIPLYPNAKLESVIPASSSENRVVTRWLSSDPSNFITSFYSDQFQKSDWQILQEPTDDLPDTFEVRRDDLEVKVSIQPQSITNPKPDQPQTATALFIEYVSSTGAAAEPRETPSSQSKNSNVFGSELPDDLPKQSDNTSGSQITTTQKSQKFNDVNAAPPELLEPIQDLAALGVLSLKSQEVKNSSNDSITNLFELTKNITRREYARWLVAANNAMYVNNPAKQIRLAPQSTPATFSDVPKTDIDFPVIQGLAETGLIPSPLSGDSTAVLFRPDAPLTREQLILWKIPLDTRQPLPTANLEAVNQTWGFQDTAKIDPKALRAVLADFQNGQQSNIRRVFGYTTLFQPKKPVSRGEAAAALSYFGTQDEGISAGEALNLKRSPN
ncbi:S-layer homology domain-containing protein [Umezakia ovalisporum]|uniref:S-layer homology domain-containing protein n=1 Tax=Umezakia ovalisporum FSS-43 TaxID=2740520 RepID=A0ABT6K3R3_9CYAN|nr:S-layer homology domain-containing protein [Umezakia ovalisporum]MDH6056936.1 S-layer homology domain-containing protein [Umezakia ovalisporum FSS-43]MDH6068386.1 S-layer homology domain-containing protein [Umezakia ovalisporum APH033B]MDH6071127.1 S-layer homology domain-containing protein [Umezakia ovalisporum CobakiLakeA]MDH6074848.1 S-layer homology domain-containing protein [Umezakia ovalisporum CS-1034]MDH6079506.1 S-layer homology domain-containing protein [Umezakia ovalisporum FSS-4